MYQRLEGGTKGGTKFVPQLVFFSLKSILIRLRKIFQILKKFVPDK